MRSKILFLGIAALAVGLSLAVWMPSPKTQIELYGEPNVEQRVSVELRDVRSNLVFQKEEAALPLGFQVPADGKYELVITNADPNLPVFISTAVNSFTREEKDQSVTRLPQSYYEINGSQLRLNTTKTYKALSKALRP